MFGQLGLKIFYKEANQKITKKQIDYEKHFAFKLGLQNMNTSYDIFQYFIKPGDLAALIIADLTVPNKGFQR